MPDPTPPKRPVGHPTTYRPEYCAKVIELGKQGYSVVEMASELGCSRPAIEERWPAKHPEFREAFARAREESQAWWERQGRLNLTTKTFQPNLYSRSMAARFPKEWRESKEQRIAGPDGKALNLGPEASVRDLMASLRKAKLGGEEPPPEDGSDLL